MNPRGLQIGNYYYNNGVERRIHLLHEDDDIEGVPIELTEEWLLKFGFEGRILKLNDYNNTLEYRQQYKEMVIWGSDGSTEGHNYRVKCEYVHQLQNLYFALTNEEL